MSSRRRRRDRRGRQGDHPEPAPPRPAAKKVDGKRRAAHEARMSRLRRARNVVFAGFLLSLAFSVPCVVAVGVGCAEFPQNVFPFLSSALLGLLLGYVLRMWREQRAFERAGTT